MSRAYSELERRAAYIGGGRWELGEDGHLWNENGNEVVGLTAWGRTHDEATMMGVYLQELHNSLPGILARLRAAEKLLAAAKDVHEVAIPSTMTALKREIDAYEAIVCEMCDGTGTVPSCGGEGCCEDDPCPKCGLKGVSGLEGP